jgi:hypothetical protein
MSYSTPSWSIFLIYNYLRSSFYVLSLDQHHTTAFLSSTKTIRVYNFRNHGSHPAIWKYRGPRAWIRSHGH